MNKATQNVTSRPMTSPTLAINELVQSMWSDGLDVIHLGFGESRMPIHPTLEAELKRNASKTGYLETAGLEELRHAIAEFHQRHWNLPVDASRIIVGPGSKSLLFGLLLGIDCDVFLPTPSWVSYAPQAELAGRQVTYLDGTFENGYEISPDAIEAAVRRYGTGRMPVLILNSPNNPTGQVTSRESLQSIAETCRRLGITVISDEIYARTTYDRKEHCSIAAFHPEGTILVGGPSKHLSLGGWRIGAAVLPDSRFGLMIRSVLKKIASEIWSSPSTAIQYATVAAYADDPEIEAYIRACTELHQFKTRLLRRSLERLGVRCTDPQGAFYFIANFDDFRSPLEILGIETSDQLSSYLLTRYNVATLPGSVFGIDPRELSLRLASSFLDMETDEKARSLMDLFVSRNHVLSKGDLPATGEAVSRISSFVEYLNQPQISS